jgi:hypothetical protein
VTLTGISNRGLLLIGILVAALWGCILAERAIVNQARQETILYLRAVPVKYKKKHAPRPAPIAAQPFPG